MRISDFSQIITVHVKIFCKFLNRIKQAVSGVFKSLPDYFGSRTHYSSTGIATAQEAVGAEAEAQEAIDAKLDAEAEKAQEAVDATEEKVKADLALVKARVKAAGVASCGFVS